MTVLADQLRLWMKLQAVLSTDAEQTNNLLNIDEIIDDYTSTATTGPGPGKFTLAALASDVQVPFGGVTHASTVIILSIQNITVKLNGTGSPAIPVIATPPDTSPTPISTAATRIQPGLVVWRGRIDSVYLANPSTTDIANVYVFVIGEAA